MEGCRTVTGSELLVGRLSEAGVEHVFGIPGEHCLSIVDAIGRRDDMRFVSVRHEGAAAFMAEAHTKLTGRLSACLATASVGAANLLSGVNVAGHDSTPMVAVVGQVATRNRGRGCWQEADLVSVFRPLCRHAVEITSPARIDEDVRGAVARTTTGRPGPVLISFPVDLQDEPVPMVPAADRRVRAPALAAEDVAAITKLLRDAERPVILAGGGVRAAAACDDLVQFAERSNAPVVTAFRRNDVFPNRHPHYVGGLTLSSSADVSACVAASDLLLVVGSRLSEVTVQRYAIPGPQHRVVHIDIDPSVVSATWFDSDIGAVADAGQALRALSAALDSTGTSPSRPWWTSWLTGLPARRERLRQAGPETRLISEIATVIDEMIPDDAVVTSDAGDFFIAAGPLIGVGGGRRYLGPTSGSMGYGLPAAIAAKLSDPARVCMALCGDGGAMMTIQELETASRYSAPVILVVFNNNCYGSIRRHQDTHHSGRRLGVELGNPDFAALGELFGFVGSTVSDAEGFRGALAQALRSPGRGHLIEVRTADQ